MTYEDAVSKMRVGKRVRHITFNGGDFFEIRRGIIISEMGHNMTNWFKGYNWQLDYWSIVELNVAGRKEERDSFIDAVRG